MRHIFFELAGVLADPARIRVHYPTHLGAVMFEHYGCSAGVWTKSYLEVRRDWDSYWSDLDLTGDDPLANYWEGLFRAAHALFRLAQVPEPEKDDLIAFSRILPDLVFARFDAFYDDVGTLLAELHAAGLRLHVATYWTAGAAHGLLAGAGVLPYFTPPTIALDLSESFEKDYALLPLKTGVPPDQCLVVDANVRALERARAAGLNVARVAEGHTLRQVIEGVLDHSPS
jgi:beta-phosphoglucomutase-like phosphatase (HAD superfamily)